MYEKSLTRKNKIKKSVGSRVFDTCNTIFMTIFCITIMFPVWDMIVRSFSRPLDISYMSINLWPKALSLDAYKYCLQNSEITWAFFVSVARTVIGTFINLTVCCLAAYSLTRSDMPFRKAITTYFLIPMFIGSGMIPAYLNIKSLGLTNTFLVYVLPSGFSMYNTIIIRNYFYSIDRSLEESAEIDGASQLCIFAKIMLPLSMPVLATVSLWVMVGQWNSWFDNMIYNQGNAKLLTLQFLLRKMLNSLTTETILSPAAMGGGAASGVDAMGTTVDVNPDTVKAATTILVLLPILMVYPFLQKYFVQGIMVGAVKG